MSQTFKDGVPENSVDRLIVLLNVTSDTIVEIERQAFEQEKLSTGVSQTFREWLPKEVDKEVTELRVRAQKLTASRSIEIRNQNVYTIETKHGITLMGHLYHMVMKRAREANESFESAYEYVYMADEGEGVCDCECHKPGCNVMHIMACCHPRPSFSKMIEEEKQRAASHHKTDQ